MNDLSPGFASVLEAQSCFRAVMSAFSTPGHFVSLPITLTPPSGLSTSCAALLLTLADAHTKIAMPEAKAAQDWLTFHTGAPLADLSDADFCVATTCPALPTLRQGTDIAPEDGATLILDLADFKGTAFRLSGPGLKDPITVTLPLDSAFLAAWHAQTRTAPRGVDIILCVGSQILALPRSLQIEKG